MMSLNDLNLTKRERKKVRLSDDYVFATVIAAPIHEKRTWGEREMGLKLAKIHMCL